MNFAQHEQNQGFSRNDRKVFLRDRPDQVLFEEVPRKRILPLWETPLANQSNPPAYLRATRKGVTLAVRAQPGAKRTAVVGIYGEGDSAQLKIAVQAPPVEGRANESLITFLAKTFGLPKSSVELVSGESSRSKVFLLTGVTCEQAESAFK